MKLHPYQTHGYRWLEERRMALLAEYGRRYKI